MNRKSKTEGGAGCTNIGCERQNIVEARSGAIFILKSEAVSMTKGHRRNIIIPLKQHLIRLRFKTKTPLATR